MPSPNSRDEEYVAVIDQDEVTDEVRDIAVKYDPLNRSGREGFHVTEDGELHIDDSKVMAEHRLIEKKIPNDAVRIVPLPSASGQLVHQYGENGFRLHELPIPEEGSVVGLQVATASGRPPPSGSWRVTLFRTLVTPARPTGSTRPNRSAGQRSRRTSSDSPTATSRRSTRTSASTNYRTPAGDGPRPVTGRLGRTGPAARRPQRALAPRSTDNGSFWR
ncbi:hypothetical protein ACFQL4_03500 [Halosimplex aquaticum]